MPKTTAESSSHLLFFGLTALAIMLLAWRLLAAYLLPAVQDEAYYFLWSKHLDFGYFDHPPLVAFMTLTSQLLENSAFAARLGTVAASMLIFWFSTQFFIRVGLRSYKALTLALIIANGNLLGLIFGFLATPDTAMLLGWTWALSEAAAALSGARPRWLTAGLATGLGLLGKYTMLLIGPVFLWALWRCDRKALRTPWPYLGGVVAALVFLPHVLWNAQNDWITFRFQLRHGLALERPDMSANALPKPLPPDPKSHEALLASSFSEIEAAEKREEKKPAPYDATLKSLNRYLGFYGSQIAIFGFLLVPMGIACTRRWQKRRVSNRDLSSPKDTSMGMSQPAVNAASWRDGETLYPWLKPLVSASAAVPLFLFGILSLFSKVEANWSAMFLIGAAALLTPLLLNERRLVIGAALLNIAAMGLVIAHANTGLLPTRPHRDRILMETHGYQNLATYVAKLQGPVFVDSYQLGAMISFYAPALVLQQWPGITRDSEFVRRTNLNPFRFADLLAFGSFWLVTTDKPPPIMRGFKARSLTQIRDCKNADLQLITAGDGVDSSERCKKPVHEWYLVRYESY